MEIAPTQTTSFVLKSSALPSAGSGGGFNEILASTAVATSPATGKADIVSGQLGVQLDKGRPYAVVYFDAAGQKLTQTPFSAPSLLEKAAQFGISLSDLNGLADQLDAKGVAYKPYQLFQGTGSDAGIDLRDLATGGLGTAYDWRVDPNVSQKAKSGADTLLANQILAQQLGVAPSGVTKQTAAAASVETANANINAVVAGAAAAAPAPTNPNADIMSGHLGVLLDKGVRPYAVVYFDDAGRKLTQTTFEPASILRKATEFSIPLNDLNGLADQLDAKGVAYKPYQLFQGTGSDAGIDLRDLANGGLGTAYDWRVDANVSQKAKSGADTLLANQILAQQLGVTQSNTTKQGAASVDAAAANANAVVANAAPAAPVTNPQADITSGHLGILLDKGVRPYAMVYFNDAGQKLTQTTFEPTSILRKAAEFGIPLSDLNGLADQMDAKGVAYKPYQLFQGTGSDAGIDLRDLANGGLGTAYDWRVDANVSQKAKSGADTLLANQILAQQLGVTPSNVTRQAA